MAQGYGSGGFGWGGGIGGGYFQGFGGGQNPGVSLNYMPQQQQIGSSQNAIGLDYLQQYMNSLNAPQAPVAPPAPMQDPDWLKWDQYMRTYPALSDLAYGYDRSRGGA